MSQWRVVCLVLTVPVLGLWPIAGQAGTPLRAVRYTPDITSVLGGTTVSPDDVAEDNLAGGVALVLAGAFPRGVRIDGYARVPGGLEYLSFDTTVSLPGGLTAGPADVVSFDGTTFALVFNAAASGVPRGANLEGVATDGTALLLAFDTTVSLPGGVTAGPADLVRFDGGSFLLAFTGAAAGVPAGLRIDGVQRLGNGHLLLSFDGSGVLGGVRFDDEDVLEHDPLAGTWQLVYDGSAQHAGWPAADLTAFAAALTCDVDGDQDVDRADINAIFAARNTAAGPGDARDVDGNGRITTNDARRCVVLCTRPNCAQ